MKLIEWLEMKTLQIRKMLRNPTISMTGALKAFKCFSLSNTNVDMKFKTLQFLTITRKPYKFDQNNQNPTNSEQYNC